MANLHGALCFTDTVNSWKPPRADHHTDNRAQTTGLHGKAQALDISSLYYRMARGDRIELLRHFHGCYDVEANLIKQDQHEARAHV